MKTLPINDVEHLFFRFCLCEFWVFSESSSMLTSVANGWSTFFATIEEIPTAEEAFLGNIFWDWLNWLNVKSSYSTCSKNYIAVKI